MTIAGVKRVLMVFMFVAVVTLFLDRHRWLNTVSGESDIPSSAGSIVDVDYVGQDTLYERVIAKIHNKAYVPPPNEACRSRAPDVIIIGVEKCGTRELIDFISMHPNVMQKRNPRYFRFFERHYLDKSGIEEGMPCVYSDQIGIVKTDNYFNINLIPELLHRFNPDLKMILMVRDPIDRIISHFTYHMAQENKEYDLSTDLKALIIDDNGEVKTRLRLIQQSTYDEAMERYLKYFKLNQILIIENREFSMDPTATLQRVEDFLGLPKFIRNDHFVKNPANGFYCPVMDGKAFCYDSSRGRHVIKNQVDTLTMKAMLDHFTPKNERFFELIGKKYVWKQTKTHRSV